MENMLKIQMIGKQLHTIKNKITNVLPRTGTEHNYILYVIAGNILALSIIAIKKRLNK